MMSLRWDVVSGLVVFPPTQEECGAHEQGSDVASATLPADADRVTMRSDEVKQPPSVLYFVFYHFKVPWNPEPSVLRPLMGMLGTLSYAICLASQGQYQTDRKFFLCSLWIDIAMLVHSVVHFACAGILIFERVYVPSHTDMISVAAMGVVSRDLI